MKFIQLLQFMEVMHPLFGYTKGNAFIAFLQIGGRNFILFCMIEAESRMQTKPVIFYVFFVWSLVEIVRYPYYITQLLNVDIAPLTWLRYTIWMPLYPFGFLCEGIIVLRNIPYFEETDKFTVSLPNAWNFAFHFPTFMRLYLLFLTIPGMFTMMSHMSQTRKKKLGRSNIERKYAWLLCHWKNSRKRAIVRKKKEQEKYQKVVKNDVVEDWSFECKKIAFNQCIPFVRWRKNQIG